MNFIFKITLATHMVYTGIPRLLLIQKCTVELSCCVLREEGKRSPVVEHKPTKSNHLNAVLACSPPCSSLCHSWQFSPHLMLDNKVHMFCLIFFLFLCQLTCQSADIMSSLCGVGVRVRVRVNNFSSKTTRPGDVLFFFKRYLIYRG